MKVILYEDVDNLGRAGEVVNVKPGYARNYLIPKKLAVPATPSNLKTLQSQKKLFEKKAMERKLDAEGIKEKIDGNSYKLQVKAGEKGKLFGAVTSQNIVELLKKDGVEISHRDVDLEDPIKELGVYNIKIKLHPNVETTIKLWVVEGE